MRDPKINPKPGDLFEVPLFGWVVLTHMTGRGGKRRYHWTTGETEGVSTKAAWLRLIEQGVPDVQ